MKQIYTFFFLLLFSTLTLKAQDCAITNLTVTILPCNNLGKFSVLINFSYQNQGNSGFKVQGNGNNYGTFQYSQLPITIGNLSGNNITNYEFVVKDIQKPNCQAAKEIGKVNCNVCEIDNLVVESGDCTSDSTFKVTIDFNHANGSNQFKLYGETKYYGLYQYSQLPLTITNYVNEGGGLALIYVEDKEFPGCAAEKTFEGPNCEGFGNCMINELVVEKGECTSSGTYEVTIDFNYVNTGNLGFDLFANGQFFGFYNYSQLPLTINNFPKSGGSHDWIKVCDNDNGDCCAIKEFETKDCSNFGGDCEIGGITVVKGECTGDNTYQIQINFPYGNTSNKFKLWANGNYFGTYNYADLPITINNFPKSGGAVDWIKVCDNEFPDCCREKEFETKECGNGGNCEIGAITVIKGECTSNSTYQITINFPHGGTTSKFKLWANGNYFGTYNYSDLPLTINNFPKSGGAVDWIKVCDNEKPDCCREKEFETKECGNGGNCEIGAITVTKGECTGNSTYQITINFAHGGTTSKFKLWANGNYFGTYNYSDLPLTINNFPKSGGAVDWIKVCDNEKPDCCREKEFETKECGAGANCEMWDLVVEKHKCDKNGHFLVDIDFNYNHVGTMGFFVIVNGVVIGTFNYADLPITVGPFVGDNMTPYVFKMKDVEFPDCSITKELGKVKCGTNAIGDKSDLKNADAKFKDGGNLIVLNNPTSTLAGTVFIYNMIGQVVFEQTLDGDLYQEELDTRMLKKESVYLLLLERNGATKSFNFFKMY